MFSSTYMFDAYISIYTNIWGQVYHFIFVWRKGKFLPSAHDRVFWNFPSRLFENLCEECTEAVHSVALWTQVTSGHEWSMYGSSPFRSTLNTSYITCGHVWSMYRSSPLCSTLNTSYITGLDMCEVCTEAVYSLALWTRVTSQVWTCVKYVPKQSIL